MHTGIGPELPENDMNTSVSVFGLKAAHLPQKGFHRTAAAMRVAVGLGVACSLGLSAARASASEPLVDQHDFLNAPASTSHEGSSEELQKLFWMCDFAASVGDLDAGQSERCSAVTAHLVRAKFKGDSEAFAAWRRLNQAMAHEQLAAGAAELSCQAAPQVELGS